LTQLAVLSDIHSNLLALEAVLRDLDQFTVDHVVIAGDVVNWGPFSAQVMKCVTQSGFAVIRGNNELYITDYGTLRAPAHWQDYTIPPWTLRQLGTHWLKVIAAWPDELTVRFPDAPSIRVVHGSPRSPTQPMFPTTADADIESILADVEETTVIAAHTHLAMDRQVDRWHVLNPGTVGLSLNGIPGATYMLLEGNARGWQAIQRHVFYNYDPLYEEFERLNFVEECGVIAHLVLEEYKTARPQVYPFLNWHKRICPSEPVSMALLESFFQVNIWDYTDPAYHVNIELNG
jgi:predicted phosphodiesterase